MIAFQNEVQIAPSLKIKFLHNMQYIDIEKIKPRFYIASSCSVNERGLFSCAKDRMGEKTCRPRTENKISRKSVFEQTITIQLK